MVSKRALVQAVPPDEFDLAGFVAGFKPATVKVRLYRRGDLLGRISELDKRIDAEQGRRSGERSFAESDPLVELVEEFNSLAKEYEDGGFEEFEFRSRNKAIHNLTFREWEAAEPDEALRDEDDLILRRMAASCVSHPELGVAGFAALQEHVGDRSFGTLLLGFVEAYNGGDPGAPFSPRHLPTPDTPGS